MQELLKRIRPVTEEDKGVLPVFSYSKIEVFKKCPMQYKIKYLDKKYTFETTLALELGNICHYVLEQKGKMLIEHNEVNYDKLFEILHNGTVETDEKTKTELLGINTLKKKYFDIWFDKSSPEDLNYEDKMKIFEKVVHEEMSETDWIPTYFEHPFDFVWDDHYHIHGFIDRIDTRTVNGKTEYRVIDYKTSKKIYAEKDLPTALQFGIYALAILNEFRTLPVQNEYHFILLDKVQFALTKGYEKRLLKSLTNVFNAIAQSSADNIFTPNPTPLCHWCSFCEHNPNAQEFKNECEYYSLWTPLNKTYAVNKKFSDTEQVIEESKQNKNIANTTRKLIF